MEKIDVTGVNGDLTERVTEMENMTFEPDPYLPVERTMKWERDVAHDSKTCSACGGMMRGWAYREKFAYCPKCGAKAEEEM